VLEWVRVGNMVVTVRDGKRNDGGGRGLVSMVARWGRRSETRGRMRYLSWRSNNWFQRRWYGCTCPMSNGNDVRWAHTSVLANVVNGEVITVVQKRVADAGFVDFDIILMGADRVFLRSRSDKDTLAMLGEAKDFFAHFFSNAVRWDKEVVPFRRGA